jgi:hypothetical protein
LTFYAYSSEISSSGSDGGGSSGLIALFNDSLSRVKLRSTNAIECLFQGSWELLIFCLFNDPLSRSYCVSLNVKMIGKESIIKSVKETGGVIRVAISIVRLNVMRFTKNY